EHGNGPVRTCQRQSEPEGRGETHSADTIKRQRVPGRCLDPVEGGAVYGGDDRVAQVRRHRCESVPTFHGWGLAPNRTGKERRLSKTSRMRSARSSRSSSVSTVSVGRPNALATCGTPRMPLSCDSPAGTPG